MKLSEVKSILQTAETVRFELENGTKVPENFHVTEIGVVTKNFIDCGGTVRNEKVANFQLWNANDFDHRLKPQKLLDIIALAEKALGMEDLEIEVEYQNQTIGRYDLGFEGKSFVLLAKTTNCLAPDKCGIPLEQLQVIAIGNACTPGGGCC
ncbi:DUF6428 family protein [Pontibacter pamirensis]|uniref:DUF6428 family protein n=1 Tax=Pontibacter pamirensis TaxID=2562824 RepID=UPI00138A525C|nr:DUF6428 family protein [Pontibacter pamirensis]